jgi:type I restriction enzyme S subunit
MTFSVRQVSLGEVCEIKQGRYLAPNQMEPTPTNECFVPVIGGNGVLGFTNQSTFSFSVPLVTCRGSKCGLMQWAEPPTWISNNAMAVYFKENQGDNFFLHQYLLNSSFDDVTTGSAQPQITVTNLSLKQILLPDLQTQKTVSLIMKNIEGKIATNYLLSKTLEDIAQTIFKSWFIDFDPVKAKMAGRKPSDMDAATAALFPDSMEESELGLIPKGWKVRSIGDSVIKQKVGKLFDSKTSFSDGSVPVLDQGKSGVVGFHDEEAGVFASPDRPLVVFANHTCLLRLISYPFSVIQNVFPLAGNRVDVVWLYFAVEGKQQFDSYKGHWPDFVLHKIIHPTEQATNAFRLTVEPLLKQKWLLEQQSKVLASLRDSLLPRLISGELQVPQEMLAS